MGCTPTARFFFPRTFRAFWLVGFFALAGSWIRPSASPAALAILAGGSGTSGRLSANPSIRSHQLLCDPVDTASGSYSVRYDPTVVNYDSGSLTAVTGYTITAAYIELDFGTATSPEPALVDINQLSSYYYYPQTGYIQVLFQQNTATYTPPGVPNGYTQVDSAGVKGDETHSMTFSYVGGVASTAFATYTIFADPGDRSFYNQDAVSSADYLTDTSDNTIPYNQIAPATVTGNMFVPEPASSGLLALTAAGLLRRRRGRPA